MKKITFTETIHAPREHVFDTMLGINDVGTYKQWTSVFDPTSTYEGNWAKGEKMYFIATDDEGNRRGLISEIAEFTPGEFVSIRHYGLLKDGKEITEGEEVESWAGILENYGVKEENGITTVTIELDADENYMEYYESTWPKSLKKLNEISE